VSVLGLMTCRSRLELCIGRWIPHTPSRDYSLVKIIIFCLAA
jgi:hypothetical protein